VPVSLSFIINIGAYMKLSNDELLHKLQDEMDAWEDVPDEDLWQDGELGAKEVSEIIFQRVVNTGDWKLMRRTNNE
tara:strand:- start:4594 stop:4821 length:228 start_codon:yes stop_codon:yes gene_type:complete